MEDFVQADSRNLPKMEYIMILEYMSNSDKHNVAEIRGAKALLSSRDTYVDSELKRSQSECILRCKVVPEHKVSAKQYTVTVKINEVDHVILETSCDGCAASAGGCKHSLVFLFWLSKRSTEPASTSVACYWRKPGLSGMRGDPVKSEDIYPASKIKLKEKDPRVLESFLVECKKRKIRNSLCTSFTEEKISFNLFDITLKLINENKDVSNFASFKAAVDEQVKGAIEFINNETKNQVKSKLWHSVRQGRLTASKLYEASRCSTDGALVQQILGGYKVPETTSIKRGKLLEALVVKEVEKKLGETVQKSGFILIDGLVGASPDGILKNCTLEVKCPISEKTIKNYVNQGVISTKVRVQMQAQMLAAHKKKSLIVCSRSFI